eukprot:CAMPEP_0169107700 /NCGR_PEP_ID=MMETSP1015-20121227/25031_1 /TAXON_ID=342587 /ORGANISM="Karlodinium micrum, Strain CCMP2283" /LENGTH=78 /DNA_ID=CAMNT_0009169267 /DNA_START=216 /DNA_END=452 /DNA_ORIENTATION=-
MGSSPTGVAYVPSSDLMAALKSQTPPFSPGNSGLNSAVTSGEKLLDNWTDLFATMSFLISVLSASSGLCLRTLDTEDD